MFLLSSGEKYWSEYLIQGPLCNPVKEEKKALAHLGTWWTPNLA